MPPLTVTQLLARLRRAVELESGATCTVVGEIGSCKTAASGHIYFTLKDESAQLSCALYAFRARSLHRPLREGMQVELTGRATVWEARGSLNFVVERVREAGLGSLQQRFEALKAKLAAEGLFSPERKRPLPRFPQSVALVTSSAGAVIQDMRHRLEQRAPWMRTYLYPVPVQGRGAEREIARALQCLGEPEAWGVPRVDYIIIARGGGSLEDLWCFNEEVLARAIATCPLPVVSAVGHETDFTIADFVADLRAPTPTAAIELTTPDAAELTERLRLTELQLRRRLRERLQMAQLRLRAVTQGVLREPLEALAPYTRRLDELSEALHARSLERLQRASLRLETRAAQLSTRLLRARCAAARSQLEHSARLLSRAISTQMQHRRAALDTLAAQLSAADPQRAVERGFALVHRADGSLARDAAALHTGDELHIRLARGSVESVVLNTHPEGS